ncbi:threonylcarbamoyl-AMP synthase [Shewanella sp. 202IG2-18]|uniref:L-threonylcarbamoyladenylate synthase n=1 Tax=Parashewanella hymeniacidonis TaxID=2807618 RepID=UPI001962149F|nr:L-threonylcarbamoyladenylate synthase [Parashewanella hymeniacidonis]MBM7073217.1 threonylcarbamoyl-AMP synthase [Parashewanella hymeniacidonis]
MKKIPAVEVKSIIEAGGIVAYPTEAVYGIGCDPDNVEALEKILKIKQRPWEKGLIIVASDFEQLKDYVDFSKLTPQQVEQVQSKWPGPVTQVMPALERVSPKLRGTFDTIAVRISAHPVVKDLCDAAGKPLVSTSANLAGEPPIRSGDEIKAQFDEHIDALILGDLGQQTQPSTIIDARTGQILR